MRADTRAPGGYELDVAAASRSSARRTDYPITPKEHGTGFLLDHRHLWLRSPRQHAILRVRHEVIDACRDYFDDARLHPGRRADLHPRRLRGHDDAVPRRVLRGHDAYLTQSGQLYMEAAAMALGKVYCFGPTFRAEKSKTRRHLTEFWMVEPEVAFARARAATMDLAEDFLVSVVARVLDKRARELEVLERDRPRWSAVKKPFPRITYDEAVGDAERPASRSSGATTSAATRRP